MAKFIDVKMTVNLRGITGQTAKQRAAIKKLPNEALDYFIAQTPVDTGSARKNTSLKGNKIHADYAYAGRLDAGSSRQAPQGMTIPTRKYIIKRLKQIFGIR